MSPVSIGILALSLSIDAFIAALGRGAKRQGIGLGRAVRTGMIFGLAEAVTPLIGWTLGMAASRYVAAVDHWIAFALLGVVGCRMILSAAQGHGSALPEHTSPWALLATAIGTSVDAMAVGVSLAFAQVHILTVALAIGVATTCMATAGLMAGGVLGLRFGRIAEAIGGGALIIMGCGILISHLAA
ncbi:manganese efflux pump [Pseudooceanicola sediminis]|uniref:Putative manganese efflux pump MntP n=1 Tax=Pseudooceanicola sediminis TaxID=2211117 RepID=A0A399J2Y5_9RHOB|nr:manganese efflux pump MntP family protein [Pseudooceanicola sediminis]KAA2315014.1 manganese efflux pump [Puniceibacterium sp. HSS470]RII38829.1 manganese efflux pump [Pseudooceanicola sediminis]|tara:strand:+ start:7677 stop:8234 length:558 start_codon:yes stop_codon:yes gene_type:complete